MPVIKYDRHAKKRMKEREVSEDEAEAAINNPDFNEPTRKGRTNALKFMNSRYLRVTYKEESDSILVVTVTLRKKPFRG